jgi:hypothetical protein
VVVYDRSCIKLHSWPRCCAQREHDNASVGIHRFPDCWNHCCSIRKCTSLASEFGRIELTVSTQSVLIYSRFGNGIATNNLSKMIAGLVLPGRPVGNMYFAAWSHNVITNAVNLSNDLKMGEYRKYSLSAIPGII